MHRSIWFSAVEDDVLRWIKAQCINDAMARELTRDLYAAYCSWGSRRGVSGVNRIMFSKALKRQAGLLLLKSNGLRYVCGLRLRQSADIGADPL